MVERAAIDRINGVDEAITVATLAAFKPVVDGDMVATVKIIPFGVEAQCAMPRCGPGGAARWGRAVKVVKRVGVVSTMLPGLNRRWSRRPCA